MAFQILCLSPSTGAVSQKQTLSFGNLVAAVLKLWKSLSQPSKISDMSEMHDNITTPDKIEICPNSKISHVAQILGQKCA